MTTDNRQLVTDNRSAAVRHAVYRDLLDMLPVASCDQLMRFAANLRLRGDLDRFLMLRTTPDVGETNTNKTFMDPPFNEERPPQGRRILRADHKEIAVFFNRKYGNRLADVPGFYRQHEAAAFRLNLPWNCVAYGYGEHYGPTRIMPKFYTGILFAPLDGFNSSFLLSSAKFGGPKAQRLSPRDQQYFTQFEEVTV